MCETQRIKYKYQMDQSNLILYHHLFRFDSRLMIKRRYRSSRVIASFFLTVYRKRSLV